MPSDRPYRKALEAEVALAELLRGRGTQWDSSVVDAFAESLPRAVPAVGRKRWTEVRPLRRSLGAAVGEIGSRSAPTLGGTIRYRRPPMPPTSLSITSPALPP